MSTVISLSAWKEKHNKNHWRTMSAITHHKTLSVKEALEYIAFAIWHKDLPKDFDGDITCEMNDDGTIEVYAVHEEEASDDKKLN